MNQRLHEIAERLDTTVEDLLEFLDSPAGRRLRRMLATGFILSVPVVMRLPWLRRSPLGKVVEISGGAVVLVRVAELVRDWERSPRSAPVVIDVPPATGATR